MNFLSSKKIIKEEERVAGEKKGKERIHGIVENLDTSNLISGKRSINALVRLLP